MHRHSQHTPSRVSEWSSAPHPTQYRSFRRRKYATERSQMPFMLTIFSTHRPRVMYFSGRWLLLRHLSKSVMYLFHIWNARLISLIAAIKKSIARSIYGRARETLQVQMCHMGVWKAYRFSFYHSSRSELFGALFVTAAVLWRQKLWFFLLLLLYIIIIAIYNYYCRDFTAGCCCCHVEAQATSHSLGA